jgi:hypothetical protein
MGKDDEASKDNPQTGSAPPPVDQGKSKTQSTGAGAGTGSGKPEDGKQDSVVQGPGGS